MRFANHWDIYRRLDLNPRANLPREGQDTRTINVADERCPPLTLPVVVLAAVPAGTMWRHRVIASCPCGGDVPTGRLGQHLRGCYELQLACAEADQTK